MVNETRAVGAWWKQQRLAAGLTQEQLAGKSGLSTRAISNLERGRTSRPYPQSLQALAAALGLPEGAGTAWATRMRAGRAPSNPSSDALRQLPAAVGHFTGRRAELYMLAGQLTSPKAVEDTVVVSAIDGMAGIGKTALAVHAAHRLADRFPDGQLFVDLHAYTKGYSPSGPGHALEALLRTLDVPAQRIPEDTEERAALYRQRLAGTRTLVLLDNAASEAQVRPLLPGAPGCLVLVTSRRRLKGLDDARTMSLDLLPLADGVSLLRAVAGPDRIPASDPLLDEIVDLCGRLPLALRIAGALLRHRPTWNLEHLASQLRDQHRRVSALSDGDRDLVTVFDLSYTELDAQHRLVFRLLGLAPGPHVDAYAAAALLDTDPDTATRLLEDLVDHNLLLGHTPGHYRLHDLSRAHARTRIARDPASEDAGALDRLLRYYAYTAQSASASIARYPRPAPAGLAPVHMPHLPGPDSAREWLRAERDNLEAASTHARALALAEHAIALTAGLAEILRSDGPFSRALELHQAAAELAQHHCRSTTAQGNALTDLGVMRLLVGDPAGAGNALGQAVEIFRAIGHQLGEAKALAELGVVRRLIGDLTRAGHDLRTALEIFRTVGHHRGHAHALTELGRVQQLGGDLAGAENALGRALQIFRAIDHDHGEANALTELGVVRRLTGDLAAAEEALDRALQIFRAIGHRHGEAYALTELGTVLRLAGDTTGGGEAFPRALEIFRAIGHQHGEAWALVHYATAVATHDVPRALRLYQQALAMNHELNKPDDEAAALEGIGECHLSNTDTDTAITYLGQALKIFMRLGMSHDTRRVKNQLDRLRERVGCGYPGKCN